MDRDNFTILRCAKNLRLAKTIHPDKIDDYGRARIFDGWTERVTNLDDCAALLDRLIHSPRLCVVRGDLVNASRATGIRRLVHPDPETGEQPTLRDTPRRWLAIDAEGIDRPPGLDLTDLPACFRVAVQRLPMAFHGADCIVQATAGHGIKPDLRLRLWFWLSRPTSGGELKRWLKGTPADPSIFAAAQIIYVSAPIFEGCTDHLPKRLARIPGAAAVQVPSSEELAQPTPREFKPLPKPSDENASRYAWAALRNAAAKVRGAAVNTRHPTCLQQTRSLARLVEGGLLTESNVKEAMAEALEQAGKTKEEGIAIAAWGLAHPSSASLPEGIR
jgi:hypothetical protein